MTDHSTQGPHPLAAALIARYRDAGLDGPVLEVADTGQTSVNVYRSPLIPGINTNALSVQASTTDLLPAVGATVARGEAHPHDAALAQQHAA